MIIFLILIIIIYLDMMIISY